LKITNGGRALPVAETHSINDVNAWEPGWFSNH
jgi:hypothetical protein